jgi:hypothetical protein
MSRRNSANVHLELPNQTPTILSRRPLAYATSSPRPSELKLLGSGAIVRYVKVELIVIGSLPAMLTIKEVSGSVTHTRQVEPVYLRDGEIVRFGQLKLLIATADGLSIVCRALSG